MNENVENDDKIQIVVPILAARWRHCTACHLT